jgi:predicted nucleic acid-binding protein
MNGKNVFVDTNILIYLLKGDDKVAKILEGKSISISFITEMELLSNRNLTPADETAIEELLQYCKIVHSDDHIIRVASKMRRTFNLGLPDSIVMATSSLAKLPLFTADKKIVRAEAIKTTSYFPDNSQ